ncbi:MAG: DUF4114 domain-containing protein [Planctomycetales bacterium]|nr:DUF4114 domain-containing protein [Planctomycetales bacterium]
MKSFAAFLTAAALLWILCAVSPVEAGRYGSVQSPARPFGLDVVDGVQLRDSDALGRDFSSNDYAWMTQVLSQPGGLSQTYSSASATTVLLDPGRLNILTDYNVRAYFVGEDAGYHNTLGFNPNGAGVSAGAMLVFPDMSTDTGRRDASAPLKPRDFVDLGLITGGSILDFFLIANGANGGTDVFTLDAGANPDGLRHVAIHARIDADSPYLLLGFEDLVGGGDMDMNDAVIALDIGVANVKNLLNTVGAPEPGSTLAFGAFLGISGLANARRRRKRARHGAGAGADDTDTT